MTYQKIIEKLKELGITPEYLNAYTEGYYEDDDDDDDDGLKTKFFEEIKIKIPEVFGQVEAISYDRSIDGQDKRFVFHFVDHNVFVGVDIWYSSYEGYGWEDEPDFMELTPFKREKVIFDTPGTIVKPDNNLKYLK